MGNVQDPCHSCIGVSLESFFWKNKKTISYISVTKSRSHVTLFRHYSHIGIPLVLGPEIPFPCSAVQRPHAPLTSKPSNQCTPYLKPASETLGLLQMTFNFKEGLLSTAIHAFLGECVFKYISNFTKSQSILWLAIESGWWLQNRWFFHSEARSLCISLGSRQVNSLQWLKGIREVLRHGILFGRWRVWPNNTITGLWR